MEDKLMKPVGTSQGLRKLLVAVSERVDALIPSEKVEAFRERLFGLVMLASTKQPELLKCTAESIVQSVMDCAQVGLDISTARGEAAMVPYFNSRRRVYECQLIIMYRGLARLARNSGEIKRIDAEVVREHDYFEFQKGSVVAVVFAPELSEERGEIRGVYALVEFVSGGIQAVWLSKSDVEKVRAVSKMSDKGPWRDWTEEMYKKTAFRNLSKWLTLESERFYRALEISDREVDLGKPAPEDDEINERMHLIERPEDDRESNPYADIGEGELFDSDGS